MPEQPDAAGFLDRRAAAFQAYYENMPLRRVVRAATGIDMQLYRRVGWGAIWQPSTCSTPGSTATTRPAATARDATARPRSDPTRTITGAAQEHWLLDGLRGSEGRAGTCSASRSSSRSSTTNGAGQRLLTTRAGTATSPPATAWPPPSTPHAQRVVLTGDVHSHWAGEIKRDYQDPASKSVAVELVTTSVTSAGNGLDEYPNTQVLLDENPHVKFFNGRRGYVRAKLTDHEMKVDFRSLSRVTEPYAPAYTSGSFVIEPGAPALHPA